jgi:hypothetical protein
MKAFPTDRAKFNAWRELNANNLNLPADWKELSCRSIIASAVVWQFQWYLQCGEDKYIRIWERYDRWPGMLGMSRRVGFVYHYGQLMGIGADGVPTQTLILLCYKIAHISCKN